MQEIAFCFFLIVCVCYTFKNHVGFFSHRFSQAKCVQYWPDIDTTMTCDIFSLITLDERKYANYCIRKVKVNNKKVRLFTSIKYNSK